MQQCAQTAHLLLIMCNNLDSKVPCFLRKKNYFFSRYNKIRQLPKDMFSEMPALRDVNLNSNLIHVINEDTWSPVLSKLNSLSLEANPIHCNADIFWVCQANIEAVSAKCQAPAAKKGT
ncbi:Immunoglobulin superfamily containing leucine-rich repeat protein, partial [Stegodyphus mimosarum]